MLNARTIETLLPLLEMVRHRHSGQWSALCPADADRGPSLGSQIVWQLDTDVSNHVVGAEGAGIEAVQSSLQTWNKRNTGQATKYSVDRGGRGD